MPRPLPPSPRALPAPWRALPTQCALCRGWGRERLCAACLQRHAAPAARCDRCALRVPPGATRCGACVAHPPAFDAAVAAVDYDHPWDALVAQFKFHEALDLSGVLARLVLQAWQAQHRPAPDRLLPVPLAPARLRERGYNQAWEIARRVARAVGRPAEPGLALRVRDTPHQPGLPKAQRTANLRGAFAVPAPRRHRVAGQRLAIVDDVLTSGATAEALAGALREAGAAAVEVWVVARTPARA